MKDAVDSGIKSVTQIPYFEGDFWPNVLEDCAKALDGDDEHDKQCQESTIDGDTEDSSCSGLPCSEALGKVHFCSDCCFCLFGCQSSVSACEPRFRNAFSSSLD